MDPYNLQFAITSFVVLVILMILSWILNLTAAQLNLMIFSGFIGALFTASRSYAQAHNAMPNLNAIAKYPLSWALIYSVFMCAGLLILQILDHNLDMNALGIAFIVMTIRDLAIGVIGFLILNLIFRKRQS